MKRRNLTIHPDGVIEYIGLDDLNIPLANVNKRRVSTITPLWWPRRPLFFLLRKIFGETGRVAAWTRRWRGPWKAVILATGEWSVFWTREQAITWELEKLNPALFDL